MSNENASLPSESEKLEIVRRLVEDVKSNGGEFEVSPEILEAIARCQKEFKSSELWALTDLEESDFLQSCSFGEILSRSACVPLDE